MRIPESCFYAHYLRTLIDGTTTTLRARVQLIFPRSFSNGKLFYLAGPLPLNHFCHIRAFLSIS